MAEKQRAHPGEKERAHPRVTASIHVNVTVATGAGRSVRAEKIANISLGGVFIEMPEPLGFGTEVSLEFKLTQERAPVRCKGFVMWSTKGKAEVPEGRKGIGVRLTDLSVADMKELSEFIDERLRRG
ncbi:MAG TPA: PilZ domain-containing protein [Myxococcota bacterium]|nr:PilZ domain-containing protein [Myxococcota bacterium]